MLPKVKDFKEVMEEAGVEQVPVMEVEVEEEDGEEVEEAGAEGEVVEETIGGEVNIEVVLRM